MASGGTFVARQRDLYLNHQTIRDNSGADLGFCERGGCQASWGSKFLRRGGGQPGLWLFQFFKGW